MFKLFRVLNVLMLTLMLRMKGSAVAFIRKPRKRDERGASAVDWLIITGIGTAVALYTAYYFEDDERQGYFYLLLYANIHKSFNIFNFAFNLIGKREHFI